MRIYKAILKYGYSNFTLNILEYCNVSEVILREQYYIDLLKPEYNILPKAGSTLGYKHTEETKAKFKSRVISPEHRLKIKKHIAFLTSSDEHKKRSKIRMLKMNEAKGILVEVFDTKTEEIKKYPSIRKAAEAIGCVHRTVLLAIKVYKEKGVQRLIKKRYLIKII